MSEEVVVVRPVGQTLDIVLLENLEARVHVDEELFEALVHPVGLALLSDLRVGHVAGVLFVEREGQKKPNVDEDQVIDDVGVISLERRVLLQGLGYVRSAHEDTLGHVEQ